jgi:hypothetical protein
MYELKDHVGEEALSSTLPLQLEFVKTKFMQIFLVTC